jgi:uncharacterized membrane protein
MTLVLGVIGVTALYLLFAWLACSILCGWLAVRAGYQEKSGLATGMLLFFVGVVVWLVILVFFPKEGAGLRAGRSG